MEESEGYTAVRLAVDDHVEAEVLQQAEERSLPTEMLSDRF